MTRENAPISNPDFRDGASLNGIPLATRFDLAEMKRNWNQALPDKVFELTLNGGVTPGGAAAGDSLDNLATRIGMKHTVQKCYPAQVMDGATFDLLPGGFTFPGGTDNALGNIIQADLEAPLLMRAWGQALANEYAFSFFNICALEFRWDWTVTANRNLSMSCSWKYWNNVNADTFFQGTTSLTTLRKTLWVENRYDTAVSPSESGTFSSATLSSDMRLSKLSMVGDWSVWTQAGGASKYVLHDHSQEWFSNYGFPVDYLVLAAR